MARLIIIGAGNSQITEASRMAQQQGARVTLAPSIDATLDLLRTGKGAELVLIEAGMDVKRLVTALAEERIVIEVAAYGIDVDAKAAAAAIRAGAKEFIPFPPKEDMIAAMLEAVAGEKSEVLYASPKMAQVIAMADKIAASDANVLITGESGTGKEVIARYIHGKSKRAAAQFVSVNCAAIPDNLLESELFGHEKGAFTGAAARRIGKFEESSNGTLLLDEISEMELRLQAKLLRALQEREIDRVGGTQPVKVNLRVLATSNRNLQNSIAAGEFREDLYFRLNVIRIDMPPLRDRVEDIPLLAEHFAKHYAEVNGMPPKEISESAMLQLAQYHWPGNVRELENTLHRAVLISGNEIDAESILLDQAMQGAPAEMFPEVGDDGGAPLVARSVESVEKELILNTLDHCQGNRTHAAKLLGISIRTLRNKLNQYEEELMKEAAAR